MDISVLLRTAGFWVLVVFLGASGRVQAADSVTSLEVANPGNYILASDAENDEDGYDRNLLNTETDVTFYRDGAPADEVDYRLVYRLLDDDGDPVVLGWTFDSDTFQYVAVYEATKFITVDFTSSDIRTGAYFRGLNVLPPHPLLGGAGGRLDHTRKYTVEVTVERDVEGDGNWVHRAEEETEPDFHYHFNHTDPDDPADNVIIRLEEVYYNRAYLVDTVEGRDTLEAEVDYKLWRWDNFEASQPSSKNIAVTFDFVLREADSGDEVPLQSNTTTGTPWVFEYRNISPRQPYMRDVHHTFELELAGGERLDSPGEEYILEIVASHVDEAGEDPIETNTVRTGAERLLHFNGTLSFGDFSATFDELGNHPEPGGTGIGYVASEIGVVEGGGRIDGHEEFLFDEDALLDVQLLSNGDAQVVDGRVGVQPDTEDRDVLVGEVAGWRFSRAHLELFSGGLEGQVSLLMPHGLGWRNTGLMEDMFGPKVYQTMIPFSSEEYNLDLEPAGDLERDLTGEEENTWFFDESWPLAFRANSISWSRSTGAFTMEPAEAAYVHEDAVAWVESHEDNLANPEEANRASNERYFRSVAAVEGDVVFEPGPDGAVRSTFAIRLEDSGNYRPHFPAEHSVAWNGETNASRVEVAAGEVDPSASYLSGVAEVDLAYNPDCPDGGCDDGTGGTSLAFLPDDERIFFTGNGGLHAEGILAVPSELHWGYIEEETFAHETDPFIEANYHSAGVRMGSGRYDDPRGGAAALLLAGVDPDDRVSLELPHTQEYRDGLGDYAGLNFRVDEEPDAVDAVSLIGGETAGFELTGRSKFYVRYSGVSGIYEAVPGTFPESMTIYGYELDFSNFGLSFLSSGNEDSRTNGHIDLPAPSDFIQDFEELTLTCLGDLDRADPPEGDTDTLSYWAAEFLALSIRFVTDDACEDESVLALGVETGGDAFPERLAGELGIFPDGDLTSAAAEGAPEGLDSRLHAPAHVTFAGPDEETYRLEPVSTGYFNREETAPDSIQGFLSLPGQMGVPFFKALKVHAHTRGDSELDEPEGAAPHLAGGWPDAGWEEGGGTFFTASGFDAENRGFPGNVSPEVYRGLSGQEDEDYLVRARQIWLEVVEFDYPLSWDRTTRSFRSFESVVNDRLVIVEAEHQIEYLSAENAEITFGASYDGLPRISLASAAYNIADEHLGVAESIAQAARGQVRDAVIGGMDDLSTLLRDRLDELLEEMLFDLTDDVIDEMFDTLEAEYEDLRSEGDQGAAIDEWVEEYRARLEEFLYDAEDTASSELVGVLQDLSDGVDDAGGVLDEVDERLGRVERAIDGLINRVRIDQNGDLIPAVNAGAFEDWLLEERQISVEVDAMVGGYPVDEDGEIIEDVEEYVSEWLEDRFGDSGGEWLSGLFSRAVDKVDGELEFGEREIVQNLVQELIDQLAPDLASNLGPLLDEATGAANEKLNGFLEKAEPTFDKIEEALERARDKISDVRSEIDELEGIAQEIQDRIDGAQDEIEAIAEGVRDRLEDFFDEFEEARPSLEENLDEGPSPFDDYDREELKQLVRSELRDRFFGTDFVAEIHVALKQRVYDVDSAAREAIDSAFQRLNDIIRDLAREHLAELDDTINPLLDTVGDYIGAGEIDGYAHINGEALRRLRLDVHLQWEVSEEMEFRGFLLIEQLNSEGSDGCELDLSEDEAVTEVTMGVEDIGVNGLPGDAVRVGVTTKFSFSTTPSFSVEGLGGSFTLTGGEIDFEGFAITEFGAAVAFGPAENYMSAATRVEFSEYEFAGGLFFGGTCSLDPIILWDPAVEEVITEGDRFTGGYVFAEGSLPISETLLGIPASCMFRISATVGAGAFYFEEGPTFGGRLVGGVSGEALCVFSISGRLEMTGVKQGDDFNFSGEGSVAGSVGKCRFCVEYEKSIRASYKAGEWSIDR